MQHDPRLHPVPQAAGMHPRRVLELEVWHGHVDRVLSSPASILPFDIARTFVRRLERDDAATVRRTGGQVTIQMLGIYGRAEGSDYAALRNWQIAAMARIREATE